MCLNITRSRIPDPTLHQTLSSDLTTAETDIHFHILTVSMPDLNSVPSSPFASSRRESSNQIPLSESPSLNILPSNQNAVNHSSTSSLPSPQLTATHPVQPQSQISPLEPGVGPGPGPTRHPRPLTAVELHLELEKEQEAVVSLPKLLSRVYSD